MAVASITMTRSWLSAYMEQVWHWLSPRFQLWRSGSSDACGRTQLLLVWRPLEPLTLSTRYCCDKSENLIKIECRLTRKPASSSSHSLSGRPSTPTSPTPSRRRMTQSRTCNRQLNILETPFFSSNLDSSKWNYNFFRGAPSQFTIFPQLLLSFTVNNINKITFTSNYSSYDYFLFLFDSHSIIFLQRFALPRANGRSLDLQVGRPLSAILAHTISTLASFENNYYLAYNYDKRVVSRCKLWYFLKIFSKKNKISERNGSGGRLGRYRSHQNVRAINSGGSCREIRRKTFKN